MNKHFVFGWILLLLAGSITSCEETEEVPTNPLTAIAGEEQEIETGFKTVLDASQSVNSIGQPMNYEWKLIEKPQGATVVTSDLNKAAVNFSADRMGDYKFELKISYQNWTDTDRVIIKVKESTEARLIANAGEDRVASISQEVQLSALGSINEIGGIMEFDWDLIQKPQGSLSQIRISNDAVTSLVPDAIGEYLIKLTVKVGSKSSFDLIKITVEQGNGSDQEPILIQGDIIVDRILTDVFLNDPEKLDYLVTKDVAVRGAKLTIEPGVRIGFEEGTGLVVAENGSLKAYTMLFETAPIIFQGKEPQKGYWDGIQLLSHNPPEYLNGLIIRDAGKLGYGLKVGNGTRLYLAYSTIHHNNGVGIAFEIGSDITEFKSNKLFDNTTSAMRIPAQVMAKVFWDSEISGNPIQITEGKILSGTNSSWPSFSVGYEMDEDLVIYNSSTFFMGAGTKLSMGTDKAIRVIAGSAIRIDGDALAPVIIEGKSKTKGSWRGLYIENSQAKQSIIDHAQINFTGSNAIAGQAPASIKLGNGASLKLSNTTLDQGKGIGLEAVASNLKLEMENNLIQNHLSYPISVSAQMVEQLDYLTRFENNTVNEVAVDGFHALAKDGGEIVWKGFAQMVPFVIKGLGKDLLIQSGMRIKAGVIIKMQNGSRIDVRDANGRLGYLNIEGIQGRPVIIEGVNDTPGSWYGITYSTNHAQNVINESIIQNAGKVMSNNFSAAITVDNVPQGSLLIQNTKITKSGQHGIAITNQFRDFLRTTNLTFEGIPGEEIYSWE